MTGHEGIRLDDVEEAIADIAAGRAVIVVDDEDRENEGDLIFAASKSTPAADGLHHPPQLGRASAPRCPATCSSGSRSRS